MPQFFRNNDAFSKFFELEASPVKINHCSKKKRKEAKGKVQKKNFKKPEKPKDFLLQKSRNLISAHARAKML